MCKLWQIKCSSDTIRFYFPKGNCCSMPGAIELAEYINPDVNLIITYSGDKTDTCYHLRDEGWIASGPINYTAPEGTIP